MRLFTAVDLTEEIRETLERLIDKLRPAAKLAWSRGSNLHITTKFIGEWPEQRLEELCGALDALPSRIPIDIEVRGLGWFPNPHNPRVFWAGVHASPGLAALAKETDAVLSKLGVAREDRPFSPHLTLARIKTPVPLLQLRQTVAALPTTDFGRLTAAAFHLYSSQLTPSGSIYTKLRDFRLLKV